ncbi:MAG: signal transduction histidine kinase [Hyphomicrobiaceae bacterium]|jgi:signal transduction histidine kinase
MRSLVSLRRGGVVAIVVLIAAHALMLVADYVARTPLSPLLIPIGFARLGILGAALFICARWQDETRISKVLLAAGSMSVVVAVWVAALRGQYQTGPLAAVAICMGASVLIPWRKREQFALTCVAYASIFITIFVRGWSVYTPQMLTVSVSVIIITVYISRESSETRRILLALEEEDLVASRKLRHLNGNLEERALERTRESKRAAADMSALCQSVSHDLRPPLRTIDGFCQLLIESATARHDDSSASRLESMRSIAQSMGERIDSLLVGVREVGSSLQKTESLIVADASSGALTPQYLLSGFRPSDATMVLLRRRSTSGVVLLLALALMASCVDALTMSKNLTLLVGIGVARAALLIICLVAIRRASEAIPVIVAAAGGVTGLVLCSMVIADLRGTHESLLVVTAGLCVAVGAFLPWGWRVQLVPVLTSAIVIARMYVMPSGSAYPAEALVLAFGCFAGSVVLAADNQSVRQQIDRHINATLHSNNALDDLNVQLDEAVASRTVNLRSARLTLENFCSQLARDLNPGLSELHRLHVILMMGSIEDQTTIERQLLCDRVESAISNMDRILRLLLDYVELLDVPLGDEIVDLSSVAEQTIAALRTADAARSVEVSITPSLVVRGDRALLSEAVSHLIHNAWKFTSEQSTAQIEFGLDVDESGQAGCFIRDDGVGFDMAHSDKLFRPFMRLEAREAYPGQGMGLARVHRIFERHGGWISTQATPGAGTIFRFRPTAQGPI